MHCSRDRWRTRLLLVYLALLSAACCPKASRVAAQHVQITSAYGAQCTASELAAPSSTAEVAALIKRLADEASQGGQAVHVRATHQGWHSTPSFPCAAAGAGPQQARTVELLMSGMARVLEADAAAHTLSVQAGMTVAGLQAAAAARSMAVPLMATPNYAGLTLSGVVATAATGSGAGGAVSTLCDALLSITWVDGRGVVHTSDRQSEAGRAICGGLGLTGVVTELQLQLAPPGKVRVATAARLRDTHLAADVHAMLAAGASGQHLVVAWRPDMQQYTMHSFERYDGPAAINASIHTLDFGQAQLFSGVLRDWQADVRSLNPLLSGLVCELAVPLLSVDHYWAVAAGSDRGAAVGIADANTIIATGCETAAGGGSAASTCSDFSQAQGLAIEDIHFVLDYPALSSWIEDVKAVIAADMPAATKKGGRTCLPPGYFWLRFGAPTDDLVGLNAAPYKQPVHVQLSLFKHSSQGSPPMKQQHILAILEQLTLCKYKGRPHWGKNADRTFLHPTCLLSDGRYPRWREWVAAVQVHDPQGLFRPPLVQAVINSSSYALAPGCGLDGSCFCTSDKHCRMPGASRLARWRCVPSSAFPEYRACRPPTLG